MTDDPVVRYPDRLVKPNDKPLRIEREKAPPLTEPVNKIRLLKTGPFWRRTDFNRHR